MQASAATGQVPPCDMGAECSVIGGMLTYPPAILQVLETSLSAADFYDHKHGTIFAAITDLHAAGKGPDEITVAEHLKRAGELDDFLTRDLIAEVAVSAGAPANAAHHAEIVKRHAVERCKRKIGAELANNGLAPPEAVERLRALGEQIGGAPRCLRRLDVAAMVENTPPEIPYVIHGLAIERTLTLISGREGEGKSLLAMSLACGVALGEDVAGFECEEARVLVVDAENGQYEIHRRVKTLGLPSSGVAVVEADGFRLGADLHHLEAVIERERPGLVILDSFRSLWPGGDENDSGAVAGVLDPLRNMLRRQGPAAILLHHVSRAGNDYRGTSAIGAGIEVGFRLARHPDDPKARDRRYLHCFKSRPAPEPEDRWLALHVERGQVFVDQTEPFVAEDDDEAPAAPKRAELAPSLLAAAAEPITWPELARAIDRSPKDGTARRLRDDLLAAGELVNVEDGRLKVPDGVAPPDTASESQDSAGCHGAGAPIGDAQMAPSTEEADRLAAESGVELIDREPGGGK